MNDVARAAASGTYRRWQWAASMSAFDVEIVAVWLASSTALVGIPLTHGWDASKRVPKGGFFAVEAVGVGRGGGGLDAPRGSPSQPVLRPSVCHALLMYAGAAPTDLLCDPMCGVGSLPAQALSQFGCPYVLSGDFGRNAVREAGRRRRYERQRAPPVAASLQLSTCGGVCSVRLNLRARAAPVMDVARWDVRTLPLRSLCLDRVVVDVPWGNRGKAEPELLRSTLQELARVLVYGGVAVVLMVRATARALERGNAESRGGLVHEDTLDVYVGGWPVAAVRLKADGRRGTWPIRY